MRPLCDCDLVEVFHFIKDFLAAANFPFELAFTAASASNLHGERVARTQPRQLLTRFLSRGFALKFENGVADLQARMLGIAAWSHSTH